MEQKYNDLLIKYDGQVSVNNELRREILEVKAKLNWEINENEQDKRKINIIIMGITETKPNETTDEIIKTIGNSLQVSLSKVRSYRLGKCPIGEKSPIKVEFELLHEKEALMMANRATKPTTSDAKLEGL
ncbi:hypothetical protein JTB14_032405 [Gonioctena quinquepunctata]|nr:hypothetical protein JTB14_032405 [Gonioctena quinquepunctata]